MFLTCLNNTVSFVFSLILRLNKKEAVYLLLQEELRREKELRKKLEAEV